MRIATLQFAPRLGDVDGNIRRANEILNRGKAISGPDGLKMVDVESLRPEVLVLPEMALTG